MNVLQLLLLVLATAFTGCAEQTKTAIEDPASTTGPSTTTPASVDPVLSGNETRAAKELLMVDCQWIRTLRHAASELVGARPPAGWGQGPTPVTEILIEAYDCGRFSLGPFERPLSMFIEVHGNRDPPEACREGDYTSSEVVTQIGVNDAEIASFLRERFGMPASFATIEHSVEPIAEANVHTWTLQIEGYEPTQLSAVQAREADVTDTYDYRRFWTNHLGGISYFDFLSTWRRAGEESPIAYGEVHDPFLHVPGITQYVGTGYALTNSSVSAPIVEFGDMSCEQLLPPPSY